MRNIMPEIFTLVQYLEALKSNLTDFRPDCCPKCGKSGLWFHAFYYRIADYVNLDLLSLNPIPIPRFRCPRCGATCSVLPECIPPHRHYPWSIQQEVLEDVLQGKSYRTISQARRPSRRTISRWIRRLKERFQIHASHLRTLLPRLGYCGQWSSFWQACLQACPLSTAMLKLNNASIVVP